MDAKTEALIRELATKLGTTVDHLWGVMVKQAYVSSITDIFMYLVLVAAAIIWVKTHRWLCKTPEDGYESRYDDYEEKATIPMTLTGIVLVVIIACAFCCIGNTVTGFVNPEYWALDHILNH